MSELLGPLHEETYLHVDEVRGDAYGFGGLTQEQRYIAGKLDVPARRAAAWRHGGGDPFGHWAAAVAQKAKQRMAPNRPPTRAAWRRPNTP